jgi:hypothetical protein
VKIFHNKEEKMKKIIISIIFVATLILNVSPVLAQPLCDKIGVVMVDHSGPEYYPSQPDGKQCVACDEGQPYTDGYDHSADSYFALKYFLAHLVNRSAAIPGFVAESFGIGFQGLPLGWAGPQGIILMPREALGTIVSDTGIDNGTYTLIDAWGEEGVIVDTSFPGADGFSGYISYNDLYSHTLVDTDGTNVYIWPQPSPYPSSDPAYPSKKEAFNTSDPLVSFYLLPRDVMNSHEDLTFDGGGLLGYGRSFLGLADWSPVAAGAPYLNGPLEDPVGSGYLYPDNGWKDMLAWDYDLSAGCDWFSCGVTSSTSNAWNERDFYEFVGLQSYQSWQRKGGREVYNEEVTGQMNAIKDWIWTNYESSLTGGATGEKDDYIKVTYMIDPCFCDGEDPTDNIHGRSLSNAVYDLIVNVGVDKIVMHDHFIQLSEMMNDGMGWHMIMMAIDEANLAIPGGGDFSMMTDMIFAPGHPMMSMMSPTLYSGLSMMMNPFKSYYDGFYLGTKDVRESTKCEGSSRIWSEGTPVTKDMWVGGVAQRSEFLAELSAKAIVELGWAVADGADDIAVFMSNHGTPTKDSWCFDSMNDYLHFNNKISFVKGVEAVLADPAFAAAMGSDVSTKTYSPYSLSPAEISDLADQSDGDDITVLDNDIQLCEVELSNSQKILFYRVSGQDADNSTDPSFLVYSAREALNHIIDVQNPLPDREITHVVDFLYNFMGQSNDLLWDHRNRGYGEELSACEGGDPQACAEQTYLNALALVYSNPEISDPADPNAWSHYIAGGTPEQHCYTAEDTGDTYGPCWDYGHNSLSPSCTGAVPSGCFVSLFTAYSLPGDPKYDAANSPAGLKVKITNGSWGWDGKIAASQNIIAEALAECATCDNDNDTVANVVDNCPNVANLDQEDADTDGTGDVCDNDTLYGTVSGDADIGIDVKLYRVSCGADLLVTSDETDVNGYYSFGNLEDLVYKIMPVDVDYTFVPEFLNAFSVYLQSIPQSYDFTATSAP